MSHIAIVTDSTADLDPAVAAAEGITVVPAAIRLGLDAIHLQEAGAARIPAERWPARLAESDPNVPRMADTFASVFNELLTEHDAVLAVLLSSRLGGAVGAARQACERLPDATRVAVIDSRSASLGLGFQALRAAALARSGASLGAIAAELESARDRYHVVFSVESVEHLRRGGRIGRSAAAIAEALRLKPLLRIDEGQIVPYERARTRIRALAELAEFVIDLPAIERIAVLYTTEQDDVLRLARAIAEERDLSPDRISLARIGPAVAAHVGPGALGVAVVEAAE